jgi:DNA repair exonuclease SbcCD ATPase subunit
MRLFVLLVLVPVLGTPEASSFGWREVLSVLGFVSPIVFGIILYLIKKKSEAELKVHEAKLKEVATSYTAELKELRTHVDTTLRDIDASYRSQLATDHSALSQHKETIEKLERSLSQLSDKLHRTAQDTLSHQNACSARYVERSVYANDIAAQKEHLRTIKELINQQIETVERLMRM